MAPGCEGECINVVEIVVVDSETGDTIHDAEITYSRSIYSPREHYSGGIEEPGRHLLWIRADGYQRRRSEIDVLGGTKEVHGGSGCGVVEYTEELDPR